MIGSKSIMESRLRRWVWIVPLASVAIVLIIVGVVTISSTTFLGSTEERFLIPDGYMGDVFVLYGVRDGKSLNKTPEGVTLQISQEGILRTRDPIHLGSASIEYYYERRDGSLEPIRNLWPSTIPRTPENVANDRDVGVFFPRNGTFRDSTGCSVQFEQFYVGTKANLLSKYTETDLGHYMHDHPDDCSK
jgi:uncharacterized protein DUF6843